MDEKEYHKLIDLTLELRHLESLIAEALEEAKKANEVIRELVLKK